MSATQEYRTICCQEEWRQGLFYQIECQGDTRRLMAGSHEGAVLLHPVDSGEKGFSWSRLVVDATLPADSVLRIYARASDEADWPQWKQWQAQLPALRGAPRPGLEDLFGPPLTQRDCWLRCSGRYLWLALELGATGSQAPAIRSLALRMELDLAAGIGDDLTEVIGLRRVGSLAGGGVGHMETRPLHRSAGDRVHLVDGQLRGLVVFKDQLFLIPCIQGDGLLPVRVLVRQIIRGRDRQLCDPEGAGSHSQGDGAILPGGHGV